MKTLLFALLIIVLNGLLGWVLNQPHDVGQDVPNGKLNSLSFAPFREGQDPVQGKFPSVNQIEEDLKLMGEKTHSIRTYASSEGTMPAVTQLAQKYGLTVIQSAWLGSGKEANKLEIDALVRSANIHPDIVKRVIVGNEVLLRGDLPPEDLITYIREVKRKIKQPVSYADVWSMYLKYPALIKEVDYITIHILPYWEDEPISVDDAPAHIERIYKQVQQEANLIAPGKPILIGESGWPSEGRQRGRAVPSVVNSAKFIRGLIKVANDNHFDYNIVEAFNQSWKSALEGVVGANWGLYSVDRKEVFPLVGKVYEDADWCKKLVASSALFLVIVLCSAKALKTLSSRQQLCFLVFLQLMLVFLINQATMLWYTSYSDFQRFITIFTVSSSTLLSVLIMRRAYNLLKKQEDAPKLGTYLDRLYTLFFIFAIYQTAQLAINGRYISFPTVSMYIPILGIMGLMLVSRLKEQQFCANKLVLRNLLGNMNTNNQKDTITGYVLILSGIALVLGESYAFLQSRDLILSHPDLSDRLLTSLTYTLVNCQLIVWLLCLGVMALPLLLCLNKKE